LEFPVVVIPDLGKKFNCADLHGEIILDAEFGISSRVHAPETGQTYPSLPFWLAGKRQKAEMLSEEMRLLYVAATRARDRLILSGTCAESRAESWADSITDYNNPVRLLRAGTYLDWLGPWLTQHAGMPDWLDAGHGAAPSWRWQIVREAEEDPPSTSINANNDKTALNDSDARNLLARLEWTYRHTQATTQPGKSSITALRREAADELEIATTFESRGPRFGTAESGAGGAAIGVAHHSFLQSLKLSKISGTTGPEEEAARLVKAGLLSGEQAALLDLEAIKRFWRSELGKQILLHQSAVQRELAFTVRLTRQTQPSISILNQIPEGEFIVVQGAVDLAVLLPGEIWIVDFKTDQVSGKALDERVREYSVQLQLYGIALNQIYKRPVTHRWLHFLKSGKTIEVADPVDLPPSSHPQQMVLSLPTR
jgi:ATP-dependent helicase/nuclease subunit A